MFFYTYLFQLFLLVNILSFGGFRHHLLKAVIRTILPIKLRPILVLQFNLLKIGAISCFRCLRQGWPWPLWDIPHSYKRLKAHQLTQILILHTFIQFKSICGVFQITLWLSISDKALNTVVQVLLLRFLDLIPGIILRLGLSLSNIGWHVANLTIYKWLFARIIYQRLLLEHRQINRFSITINVYRLLITIDSTFLIAIFECTCLVILAGFLYFGLSRSALLLSRGAFFSAFTNYGLTPVHWWMLLTRNIKDLRQLFRINIILFHMAFLHLALVIYSISFEIIMIKCLFQCDPFLWIFN